MQLLRRIGPRLLLVGVFVIDSPHCGSGNPDFARLASAYLEAGRHREALVAARRAQRQFGSDPSSHLVAALAHAALQQPSRALTALARGLRAEPGDERMHRALRQLCSEFGCYVPAAAMLDKQAQRTPDEPHVLATLAWLLHELGEDERAFAVLADAAATPDRDAFTALTLADVYALRRQHGEAISVLRQALESYPADLELLVALGDAHLRTDSLAAAAGAFEHALSVTDRPGPLAVRIAGRYYEHGARRPAIELYERAVAWGERNATVLNNLAWGYCEEEIRLSRALALATRAVKMEPDNVVYLDTYAEAMFRNGQSERALAVIGRAIDLEPADGENHPYLLRQRVRFAGAASRP